MRSSKTVTFALSKTTHSIAGGAKGIEKLRSAQLLVGKSMQSEKLLKDNVFIDINIKIDAHRSLNTCNGVIRSRDLISCTENEILEDSEIRV